MVFHPEIADLNTSFKNSDAKQQEESKTCCFACLILSGLLILLIEL
jgi:hypothetical protein